MDDPDHRRGEAERPGEPPAAAETIGEARCDRHPEAPALYRCDGCGRLLCADCALPQTRLVVCAHCGELAVPLPSGLPDEPPELEARPLAPLESREGWLALLRWPLGGRQGVLLLVLCVLLAGSAGLDAIAGEVGCVAFVPFAFLVLLFPGLLGDSTRAAAAGLGDLGEWPDYRSPGGRAYEAFLFFFVAGFALIPVSGVLVGLDCDLRVAAGGRMGAGCVVALAIALWPAALIWMTLWGAAATSGSLRATLDPRAALGRLARAPHATAVAATIGWLSMLVGPTLRSALPRGSVPAMIAEALPGAYGALVSARAAGLLFRQAGGGGPEPGAGA